LIQKLSKLKNYTQSLVIIVKHKHLLRTINEILQVSEKSNWITAKKHKTYKKGMTTLEEKHTSIQKNFKESHDESLNEI
jgi:hypothetical protein